jgi:hypothetical protein
VAAAQAQRQALIAKQKAALRCVGSGSRTGSTGLTVWYSAEQADFIARRDGPVQGNAWERVVGMVSLSQVHEKVGCVCLLFFVTC